MKRMCICFTDVFVFVFLFFSIFFPSATKYETTGTAERIFTKLLPNDSGENVVSNVVWKWWLGPPNTKKTAANTQHTIANDSTPV